MISATIFAGKEFSIPLFFNLFCKWFMLYLFIYYVYWHPIWFPFRIMLLSFNSTTTGVISVAWTTYHSGVVEFTLGFSWVHNPQSFIVFYLVVFFSTIVFSSFFLLNIVWLSSENPIRIYNILLRSPAWLV